MKLINADTLNYVRVRIYHDDGTIGGYNAVVPSSEIKNAPTVDAIPIEWMLNDWDSKELEDVGYQVMRRIIADWAERKDEYVTLHHEDIHFNSEEDEKAFYEALAEMKNTRSFTAEEWEFYKKVNREKMQKTGLNIRDFMGEERKEE